jgi:hypothetical protein
MNFLRRTWLCIYNMLLEAWTWLVWFKEPRGVLYWPIEQIKYWFYFEEFWHWHPDYHPSWDRYRKRTGMSRDPVTDH